MAQESPKDRETTNEAVAGPRIVDLIKIHDHRGNLTFIESGNHVPFTINRIYYLYDVPGGEGRAGHALKVTKQFIIAASGSFDVILEFGGCEYRFQLNRSYFGLYIPPMAWRKLENFSSGSVALCLASTFYDPTDYCRDYEEYCRLLNA